MKSTPTRSTKVLVIGVDAASPALLRRWADDGTLPNIHALISRGVTGTTRGIEGFHVGSTWPSFYTGTTPARHGFHYLTQLRPGTYELYRPATEMIARDPFWTHLSRAGRRVAILDVPLTRLDPSLNGIHVVEWGGHDSAYGFDAHPEDARNMIQGRFGPHPSGPSCDGVRRTSQDYRSFVDALVRGIQMKAQLTTHFLHEGGWDFFMQVFTESHCVGHQCWHLHDSRHPAHDAAVAGVIGDPLRRVYTAIDTAIGELLHAAGDALVVVLAAHGMCYWYGAQFLLRDILFRLGVAHRPNAVPAEAGRFAATIASARRIARLLPPSVRARVPLRQWLRRRPARAPHRPSIGVDPSSSRCFPQHNGLAVGGIRLNLVGREPHGVLATGAEADAFVRELTEDLTSILDERTGKPLVRRVMRTADLYSGDHLMNLPDLLVEWSDETPTGSTMVGNGEAASVRASSSKIGVLEGVNTYGRTGEHRPQGLYIAAGPTIRSTLLSRDVSILDFAPTFTHFLGVERADYDGRILSEILGNGSIKPPA